MYCKLIICIILITTNVFAAELEKNHLEPDLSPFMGISIVTDYYSQVTKLFSKAYAPSVKIRTVVLPSFKPEYVIGVHERDKKYYAFKLSAKKQFWIEYQKNKFKEVSNEIEVNESEVEISKQVYEILDNVWRKMIRETRYSENPYDGLDGISYHFSGLRLPTGYAWSPKPNSQTGYLVKLSELLGQLVESKDSKTIEKNIMNTAAILLDSLK